MVKEYILKDAFASAVQFDGSNEDELYDFGVNLQKRPNGYLVANIKIMMGDILQIPVNAGDYFIKNSNGDISHMPPNLFKKTYSEIDERMHICASSLY